MEGILVFSIFGLIGFAEFDLVELVAGGGSWMADDALVVDNLRPLDVLDFLEDSGVEHKAEEINYFVRYWLVETLQIK